MAKETQEMSEEVEEGIVTILRAGPVTTHMGDFNLTEYRIGPHVVAETVGDITGAFAMAKDPVRIFPVGNWSTMNLIARCQRMYDRKAYIDATQQPGSTSTNGVMYPRNRNKEVRFVMGGFDAKLRGPALFVGKGISGESDIIRDRSLFKVDAKLPCKHILPCRSIITPGNATFLKKLITSTKAAKKLTDAQLAALETSLSALQRGGPFTVLAKHPDTQGGGNMDLLLGPGGLFSGYVLKVPFISRIKYPSELFDILDKFRLKFPYDALPKRTLLICAQIWCDLEEKKDQPWEGWTESEFDREGVEPVPLAQFLVYFPHLPRWTEFNGLAEYPHPNRFVRQAYSTDTKGLAKNSSFSHTKISETSIDEERVKQLVKQAQPMPGCPPVSERLDIYPFTFPGTRMMGVKGYPTSPLARDACGLGSVYLWGLPSYTPAPSGIRAIRIVAPTIIAQELVCGNAKMHVFAPEDSEACRDWVKISNVPICLTAPNYTDGPMWRGVERTLNPVTRQTPERDEIASRDVTAGPESMAEREVARDGSAGDMPGGPPMSPNSVSINQDFGDDDESMLDPEPDVENVLDDNQPMSNEHQSDPPQEGVEKTAIITTTNNAKEFDGTLIIESSHIGDPTKRAHGNATSAPVQSVTGSYSPLQAITQLEEGMKSPPGLRQSTEGGFETMVPVHRGDLEQITKLVRDLPVYVHHSIGDFRDFVITLYEGKQCLYRHGREPLGVCFREGLLAAQSDIEKVYKIKSSYTDTSPRIFGGQFDGETILLLLCRLAGYNPAEYSDWESCLIAQPETWDNRMFLVKLRSFSKHWDSLETSYFNEQPAGGTELGQTAAMEVNRVFKHLMEDLRPGMELVNKLATLVEAF